MTEEKCKLPSIQDVEQLLVGDFRGQKIYFRVQRISAFDLKRRFGSCGFNALGVTRETFLETLRSGLGNPEVLRLIGAQIENDYERDRHNLLLSKDYLQVLQSLKGQLEHYQSEQSQKKVSEITGRLEKFLINRGLAEDYLSQNIPEEYLGAMVALAWSKVTYRTLRIWKYRNPANLSSRDIYVADSLSNYVEQDQNPIDIIHTRDEGHYDRLLCQPIPPSASVDLSSRSGNTNIPSSTGLASTQPVIGNTSSSVSIASFSDQTVDPLLGMLDLPKKPGDDICKRLYQEAISSNGIAFFYKLRNKETFGIDRDERFFYTKGIVYDPNGKHTWHVNLSWVLGLIHRKKKIIINSQVLAYNVWRKDFVPEDNAQLKLSQFSAFSREIASVMKIGYSIGMQDDCMITLSPPKEDHSRFKLVDINPTADEVEASIKQILLFIFDCISERIELTKYLSAFEERYFPREGKYKGFEEEDNNDPRSLAYYHRKIDSTLMELACGIEKVFNLSMVELIKLASALSAKGWFYPEESEKPGMLSMDFEKRCEEEKAHKENEGDDEEDHQPHEEDGHEENEGDIVHGEDHQAHESDRDGGNEEDDVHEGDEHEENDDEAYYRRPLF